MRERARHTTEELNGSTVDLRLLWMLHVSLSSSLPCSHSAVQTQRESNDCPQSTISTTRRRSRRNRNIHTHAVCTDLVFCSCAGIFGWKQYLFATCILMQRRTVRRWSRLICCCCCCYTLNHYDCFQSRSRRRNQSRKKINSSPSKFTFIAARVRLTIIERENSRDFSFTLLIKTVIFSPWATLFTFNDNKTIFAVDATEIVQTFQ